MGDGTLVPIDTAVKFEMMRKSSRQNLQIQHRDLQRMFGETLQLNDLDLKSSLADIRRTKKVYYQKQLYLEKQRKRIQRQRDRTLMYRKRLFTFIETENKRQVEAEKQRVEKMKGRRVVEAPDSSRKEKPKKKLSTAEDLSNLLTQDTTLLNASKDDQKEKESKTNRGENPRSRIQRSLTSVESKTEQVRANSRTEMDEMLYSQLMRSKTLPGPEFSKIFGAQMKQLPPISMIVLTSMDQSNKDVKQISNRNTPARSTSLPPIKSEGRPEASYGRHGTIHTVQEEPEDDLDIHDDGVDEYDSEDDVELPVMRPLGNEPKRKMGIVEKT